MSNHGNHGRLQPAWPCHVSSFPPPLSRLPPCLDDSESVNHHPLLRLPFCFLTLIAGVHPTALAPFLFRVFVPAKKSWSRSLRRYFACFVGLFWPELLRPELLLRGRFGAELLPSRAFLDAALRCAEAIKAEYLFWINSIVFFFF